MQYKQSMAGHLLKEKKEHKTRSREIHMEGTFQSNTRGFGFVIVNGIESDLYIPEGKTMNAFYGDLVEVKLRPGYDERLVNQYRAAREAVSEGREPEKVSKVRTQHRTEAEVVRILEHTVKTVVGTYEIDGKHGYVIPDNRHIPYDIHVAKQDAGGAVSGHKVVLQITDYGSSKKNASGKVVEILGHMDDPGVDILSIIRANDLPEAFPEKVMEQVRTSIPTEINASDYIGARAKKKGSKIADLRRTLMVTIDGLDTKDIDDAVSLRKTEDGLYELGVHIADVSYYVTEGSPLDEEALNRATSVYLVDRVIPMLPHELSNGICSLNEGTDRLALSCIMILDKNGHMVDHHITESVIRVDARLSYTGVHALLIDNDSSEITEHLKKQGIKRGIKAKTEEIAAMLREMEKLSTVLSKRRKERGAIDFETKEAKITLDENGHPTDIRPYEQNESNTLIENFMLMANETVAQHFYWLETPFVYRSHGNPDPEKIRQLTKFLRSIGVSVKTSADGSDIHPKEIAGLLEKIKGTPEEPTLTRMTLRSMQQANYTTDCGGHFGLALRYYCHFTSPIRRYPDLQIHRIIREYLRDDGLSEERTAHYNAILPEVCQKSSHNERRADEAERETDKQKMCEYMSERIGEVYDGVISGLTGWGIYVELPNTIEGLIPMACLFDDYYVFDEKSYILVGEHTHAQYHLGDKIRVKVAAVDIVQRTIDFTLEAGNNGTSKRSSKTRSE